LFLLFSLVSASAFAGNGFAIKTVVIDAGHGGKDPGATGPGKTNEKDVALAVALKLGADIQKNFPDVNVIYTRKTDVFIELHERAEIANKNKADLFIAIHCNSSTSPTVYGTSTYVLGLHRTEANLEVAKRENSVILLEDDRDKNYEFDPNSSEGNIIMSLRQNAFLDQSIDIASKIEAQYETNAKRKSLGVKQAGFYVIYKTAMPSLLSEIGFISNPNEEKFLASDKGQEQIAGSILKAFKDYKFEMENSEGEQFAYQEAKRKAEAADTATRSKPTPDHSSRPAVTSTSASSSTPATTTAVKPTSAASSTASQTDPDNITVTLLSGRKIKKPLDNASGGGTTPEAVKAPESVKTAPAPVVSDTKSETPAPAPPAKTSVDTAKSPEPAQVTPAPEPVATTPAKTDVVVEKTQPEIKPTPAPDTTAQVQEKPVKKVTPGHSGGATTTTPVAEKPTPKPSTTETKPAKTEPKPVQKVPAVTKTEEKPVATVKPVKKATEVEAPVKPAVKPVAEDNSGKMTFKVQLIALKGPMKASEVTKVTKVLGNITNEAIPDKGLIRYYAGNSKTYSEARRKIEIAVEAGYKDAFVVGFKDGVRYGPEKLKAYQNQ